MADSYVTFGATIKCSCGDKTAKLTVYPDRTVFLTEKPMANISDHVSMYNIAPFGKCHTTRYPATGSATAANHGTLTPMPCVPGTISEWLQGKDDYIIKGKPALLKSSYCKCQWGGIITITDDGQTDTGKPDMSREHRETQEEMKTKQDAATPNANKGKNQSRTSIVLDDETTKSELSSFLAEGDIAEVESTKIWEHISSESQSSIGHNAVFKATVPDNPQTGCASNDILSNKELSDLQAKLLALAKKPSQFWSKYDQEVIEKINDLRRKKLWPF